MGGDAALLGPFEDGAVFDLQVSGGLAASEPHGVHEFCFILLVFPQAPNFNALWVTIAVQFANRISAAFTAILQRHHSSMATRDVVPFLH